MISRNDHFLSFGSPKFLALNTEQQKSIEDKDVVNAVTSSSFLVHLFSRSQEVRPWLIGSFMAPVGKEDKKFISRGIRDSILGTTDRLTSDDMS